MTALVKPVIRCDHCDNYVEPFAADVIIGRTGVHPSHALTGRDRLPAGWTSWTGNDGETYDACPECRAWSWA